MFIVIKVCCCDCTTIRAVITVRMSMGSSPVVKDTLTHYPFQSPGTLCAYIKLADLLNGIALHLWFTLCIAVLAILVTFCTFLWYIVDYIYTFQPVSVPNHRASAHVSVYSNVCVY